MRVRATYTYAILDISLEAYLEIRGKLKAVGYSDRFHDSQDGEVIDMHGIPLQSANGTNSQSIEEPEKSANNKSEVERG